MSLGNFTNIPGQPKTFKDSEKLKSFLETIHIYNNLLEGQDTLQMIQNHPAQTTL